MDWRIVVDLPGLSAAEQMAADERLAREPIPTVRFFAWDPPALSWGFRQRVPTWLARALRSAQGIEGVERPTGGGIAVHGSDVSLSVVVPRRQDRSLEALMQAVCGSAAHLCRSYGAAADTAPHQDCGGQITYCLAELSPYAVMIGGRKVAGFALRRYPQTWLIQGSLLVRPLRGALRAAMPALAVQRLEGRAVSLAEAVAEAVTEAGAAERWGAHWASWWEDDFADCEHADDADCSHLRHPVLNLRNPC